MLRLNPKEYTGGRISIERTPPDALDLVQERLKGIKKKFPESLIASSDDVIDIMKREGWNISIAEPFGMVRTEWTMWHAIREFIQNAIDENEEAIGVTGYKSFVDEKGVHIGDEGRGIRERHLSIEAFKAEQAGARGRFGEGLKIAAMVCLRYGHPVFIDSVRAQYRAVMYVQAFWSTLEEKWDTLVVSAFIHRKGQRQLGSIITVNGYKRDFADRVFLNHKDSILYSHKITEDKHDADYVGKITMNQIARPFNMYYLASEVKDDYDLRKYFHGDPSQIEEQSVIVPSLFVKDLYVTHINAMYSYNLPLRPGLDISPDRVIAKPESVLSYIQRIWECVMLYAIRQPPSEEARELFRTLLKLHLKPTNKFYQTEEWKISFTSFGRSYYEFIKIEIENILGVSLNKVAVVTDYAIIAEMKHATDFKLLCSSLFQRSFVAFLYHLGAWNEDKLRKLFLSRQVTDIPEHNKTLLDNIVEQAAVVLMNSIRQSHYYRHRQPTKQIHPDFSLASGISDEGGNKASGVYNSLQHHISIIAPSIQIERGLHLRHRIDRYLVQDYTQFLRYVKKAPEFKAILPLATIFHELTHALTSCKDDRLGDYAGYATTVIKEITDAKQSAQDAVDILNYSPSGRYAELVATAIGVEVLKIVVKRLKTGREFGKYTHDPVTEKVHKERHVPQLPPGLVNDINALYAIRIIDLRNAKAIQHIIEQFQDVAKRLHEFLGSERAKLREKSRIEHEEWLRRHPEIG